MVALLSPPTIANINDIGQSKGHPTSYEFAVEHSPFVVPDAETLKAPTALSLCGTMGWYSLKRDATWGGV